MRLLLASVLIAAIASLSTGCVPFGCSAASYQGANDKVYARGSDQLILCENGGFTADLATGTVEGYYTDNAPGSTVAVVGTTGGTDQPAFDLSNNADGTASIPSFGAGTWTEVALDKTGLDHADTRCQDLETRAWWTASH
ncbi:MAG: hypothetical protein ACM31C_21780 [Acidobacteriota bacterium]